MTAPGCRSTCCKVTPLTCLCCPSWLNQCGQLFNNHTQPIRVDVLISNNYSLVILRRRLELTDRWIDTLLITRWCFERLLTSVTPSWLPSSQCAAQGNYTVVNYLWLMSKVRLMRLDTATGLSGLSRLRRCERVCFSVWAAAPVRWRVPVNSFLLYMELGHVCFAQRHHTMWREAATVLLSVSSACGTDVHWRWTVCGAGLASGRMGGCPLESCVCVCLFAHTLSRIWTSGMSCISLLAAAHMNYRKFIIPQQSVCCQWWSVMLPYEQSSSGKP